MLEICSKTYLLLIPPRSCWYAGGNLPSLWIIKVLTRAFMTATAASATTASSAALLRKIAWDHDGEGAKGLV